MLLRDVVMTNSQFSTGSCNHCLMGFKVSWLNCRAGNLHKYSQEGIIHINLPLYHMCAQMCIYLRFVSNVNPISSKVCIIAFTHFSEAYVMYVKNEKGVR
jgi:nitrate reductase beta subunit